VTKAIAPKMKNKTTVSIDIILMHNFSKLIKPPK
jgi:hypothetical protein